MSNYSQVTSFGPKDNLASGNASKKILGTEIDTELSAIATAVSSKSEEEIPSGSIMLFLQSGTPAGWTLITTWDDRVPLMESTAAQGGSAGGNWTITAHTYNHTHNASSTTNVSSIAASNDGPFGSTLSNNPTVTFNSDNHTHAAPNATTNTSVSNPNSATINHDASWRPSYIKALPCSKN
jgi:hypothetical protein